MVTPCLAFQFLLSMAFSSSVNADKQSSRNRSRYLDMSLWCFGTLTIVDVTHAPKPNQTNGGAPKTTLGEQKLLAKHSKHIDPDKPAYVRRKKGQTTVHDCDYKTKLLPISKVNPSMEH